MIICVCDGLCDHACWVGVEWGWGQGGRMFRCCPCATTAANRRTERLEQRSTGVTIASGTGDAADASRSRWGLQQPAVAIAAGRDSTRRAAVASETSDAADASRSRWGLQQPAVQRPARCSSTHAPQTPRAADRSFSREPHSMRRWSCCRCALVAAAPATSKRLVLPLSSSSPSPPPRHDTVARIHAQ